MAQHRDVQKRAQAEIDDAIPTNRLPALADIDSIPYVLATIKETLRWNPSLTLGDSALLTTQMPSLKESRGTSSQ
jgi:cytochrome P450